MIILIKSMTGYGRYEQTIDGWLIGVEVKSVNHRYLEYTARFPKGYGFLENKLKHPLCQRCQYRTRFDN